MNLNAQKLLPSKKARWIWDGSDRYGYNYYLRVRRTFTVGRVRSASLLVTADASYQAWVNGRCLGHGPAKSAGESRSVDWRDLLPFLVPGENVLEILVLSVGVGTMTYCSGEAGLLFELRLDSTIIGSDGKAQVRRDAGHLRPTVRRWILPCLEDVDAPARPGAWRPAKIVAKAIRLYPRRVPLPTREEVHPKRLVELERVELPSFSVSFRIKPALVSAEEARRANKFDTPATFRVPIFSPKAQTLEFTPTLGAVEWSFAGKKLFTGSGWGLWKPEESRTVIRLKAGRNELVGRHQDNHFEDISLAGFVAEEVRVGPMEVERDDGRKFQLEPMPFANAHDLAVGARVLAAGTVRRTIWDLGCVYNGWISFAAEGRKGSVLLLAFFEGMEDGVPKRIQWADGCNNALTYRLREGWQEFESFFPYGVRYIAVHEINGPVNVKSLRALKATCSRKTRGHFLSDNPLFNGIYQISRQVIESATDDTFTDCPTFEQVNWNFDNRMAAQADMLITGNDDIIRNSILLFADDPARAGTVASQTPSTWERQIPLWSFHWILWCWDYYWHTGDQAFLRKVFPCIREGIQEALGRIGPRGLMEWNGVWHFIDWAHGRDDEHAVNAAEQAGLLAAMDVAGKIAAVLGRRADFAQARASLTRAIRRRLWNPARRCFVNSLHEDGRLSASCSQATNAIMALYGAADAGWSKKLAESLRRGRNPLAEPGSAIGYYYLFELLDRYGHGEPILAAVGRRWGEMLAAGDGTTWEMFSDFNKSSWPTRSRCHPYGAYVVKYLVKYILGVQSLAPGFATVRVAPRPPREMNSCQGSVVTPHGLLRVSWRRKGRGFDLRVDAPKGVKVTKALF
jgi:hypothetical protein